MSSKTRKLIWSVPLMATLAVVGALAVFVALGLPNADPAQAQDGGFTTNPSAPVIDSQSASPPGVAVGNGSLTVTWALPATGLGTPTYDAFSVQYHMVAAGGTVPLATSTGWVDAPGTMNLGRGDLSHQITDLTNGSNYFVRVALARAGGGMPAVGTYGVSSAEAAPASVAPGMPMVAVQQTRDDAITVTWMPPADKGGSDITGYVAQLMRAANQTADFDDNPANADSLIPDASDWIPDISAFTTPDEGLPINLGVLMTLPATTTSVTWDSLVNGVQYEARVFALNSVQTATATVTDNELRGLVNPGMASITMAEAADIELLDFTAMIESDSTTSSGGPRLTVTFGSLTSGLPVGSSIVLYLEDDFQQPDSIPASSVFFVADQDRSERTGSGASVYAVNAPIIKTGAYFDEDKKDIAIQVLIPDLCTTDTIPCSGLNGPEGDQRFRMVILPTSGIKNPPEAGTHSVYFDVLGPADEIPTASNVRGRNDALRTAETEQTLGTVAKITLSDVDNSRGYEMTVAGSGFNNGTSASVHVLNTGGTSNMYLWDALNCPQMIRAVGMTPTGITATDMASPYCKMYAGLGATEKAKVDGLDFTKGAPEAELCGAIILKGSREGSADVGSDDKVDVTFAVTVPTFKAGSANYICMVDGEGRMSNTDVEDFKLEPSIRVVPSAANAGDTINVFAQDFPMAGAVFTQLKIADQVITDFDSGGSIGQDGAATVTFDLPGSVGGSPLEGTVRIDARWGGVPPFDTDKGISEDAKITITGSQLNVSKGEALPNELITLTGDGFGTGSGNHVMAEKITIDGVPLLIDEDSKNSDDEVDVSNAGQFVASVILWPDDDSGSNPTLIAGSHTIEVEDENGFFGSVVIIIPEPSITVVPAVAGPRDVVSISGKSWPVDNLDGAAPPAIDISVSDGARTRRYSAFADSSGRWHVEHRVASDVAIPSTNQVRAEMGTDIVEVSSFEVPAAIISIEPAMGQPGDFINLTVDGMPVYAAVDNVKIAGRDVLPVGNFSTDASGSVTVADVLIPGLDPGTYSVQLDVDDTVAIGSFEVLSEGPSGLSTAVGDALAEVGDNLVVVWHFNTASKVWTFYDPRPETAEFNTLSALIDGQAYLVLVSETQQDVVLNNETRNLTCVGGDCWNQIVW